MIKIDVQTKTIPALGIGCDIQYISYISLGTSLQKYYTSKTCQTPPYPHAGKHVDHKRTRAP
jgi:hypothetical protein